MKQCGNCGQVNQDNAMQCCRCGAPLQVMNLQQKSSPVKKIIIIIASIIIIFGLCCCGGFGLMMKYIKDGAMEGKPGFSWTNNITGEKYGEAADDETESNIDDIINDLDDLEDVDNTFDNSYESGHFNSAEVMLCDVDNVSITTDLANLRYDAYTNVITLYVDACNDNRSQVNIHVENVEVNGSASNVSNTDFYLELGSATEYDGMSQYAYSESMYIDLNSDFKDKLSSIKFDFVLESSDGCKVVAKDCLITGLDNNVPLTNSAYKNYDISDDSLDLDKDYDTTSTYPDIKTVGFDGYITAEIPNDWVNFVDVDLAPNDYIKQYTDLENKYILTIAKYDYLDAKATDDSIEQRCLNSGAVRIADEYIVEDGVEFYGFGYECPGNIMYDGIIASNGTKGFMISLETTSAVVMDEYTDVFYDIIDTVRPFGMDIIL